MTTSISGNSSFVSPTPPAAAPAQQAANDAGKQLNKTFDQFLMLLTTQLKNQDPLSPMDSTEFTNQLVSFSGVEQQIKINDNLGKLLAYSKASETTLGLSFIGMIVDMSGDTFKYYGEGGVQTSYRLPETASTTQISVLDAQGSVVYSRAGATTTGLHEFIWDGKNNEGQQMPAGKYQVRIGALDSQQKSMTVTTVVPGIVEGIESGDDGLMLLINDQKVPMGDIKRATL